MVLLAPTCANACKRDSRTTFPSSLAKPRSSIAKSLRTKVVIGKSPLFMSLIILGYIFGIIHKSQYSNDIVIWLYVFNAVLVSIDLFLYCLYIGRNRRELMKQNTEEK